ncbi:MAG: hypothetical protein H0W83_10395 [Planctomycetes bacterium]|nr:hypothetical protein [Planctomycetota bacterium]
MSTSHASTYPDLFGRCVADAIPGILRRQRADGAIVYDEKAPIVYPQQAIFPLAYVWAGLDPDRRHHHSTAVRDAIIKLGDHLVSRYNDKGEFTYDSYGNLVSGVDQRLTYAWTEALRILREAGGDFAFDRWGDRIVRACETLIAHRLQRLVGIRRFIGRIMGTSTNHVSLYVSTIHRAGEVLERPDLCSFVLPIGRALAADIHPDGYWEEHGDLLRSGGPTPSYNYLTIKGMGLMYAWTREAVFRSAIDAATRFHARFAYPDASFFDLIDERVRSGHDSAPRVWGLFAFSHSPEGRGAAIAHFRGWRMHHQHLEDVGPETLARHCENHLYWNPGEVVPAPFERPDHSATMVLPAGIFRRHAWSIGLSSMRATNAEDPAYRDNGFALERQKLFSIWHPRTGLLIDGSHSKHQLENSTFSSLGEYANDWWPCGGSVSEEDGDLIVRAAYKTFFASVRVTPVDDRTLQLHFSVDPAGCRGPFTAGFTLARSASQARSLTDQVLELSAEAFVATGKDLGGGFRYGPATISGPDDFSLHWPFAPFNSYTADHKPWHHDHLLRVSVVLTPERTQASFTVTMDG